MKLYELFEIISESEALWINDGSESPIVYDGRNDIDERYNNCNIKKLTVGGDGILTVELESIEDMIHGILKTMDECDLVEMWNTYCFSYGESEKHIYSMDEFDDVFYGECPSDIAEIVSVGNYYKYADWFTNDYCLECFSDLDDNIEFDDLVDCIIENNTCLGNSEIREIIER